MENFEHGSDIYSFAKKIHTTPQKIIDFSSNINFLLPSLKFNVDISKYPNKHYDSLKETIAKKYNINKQYIQLFNGANEAIFTITKQFEHITLYAPIYSEYKNANNYSLINRFSRPYTIPKKNSLVVFVNPSTPDGKCYDLKPFFEIWQKQKAIVLIDESFLEFTQLQSAISYLESYGKLIILKSFSKFYSCPGVRLAFIISKLQFKTPLWNISSFDSNYIENMLQNKRFYIKTKKFTSQNKLLLENILSESGLFEKIYNSCANFVLCKLRNITAEVLQEQLAQSRILIRNCSNFDFLNNYYVRFAVKSKKDLLLLRKAFSCIK